jgi:N-acetylmuramoyl-L-alanine amidase
MNGDKTKEVYYLKRLILFGAKIDIDTKKYEKELNRLDKSTIKKKHTTISKLPKIEKKVQKKAKKQKNTHSLKELFANLDNYGLDHNKKVQKKTNAILEKPKPIIKHNSKYSIRSVKVNGNSIVIDFNKNVNSTFVKFIETKNKRYYSDIFYIKGNFKDAKPTKLKINGIDKIVVSQYQTKKLKISLRAKKNLKTIYIVNDKQIVIKILNLGKIKGKITKSKVKLLNQNIYYPSKKIIVIDAGHGGRDSGAVGKGRRYEKNVVLSIAKYLRSDLQKKGYKVYMTRYKDVFVKLSHRTQYANKKHANIFVSIHANATKASRAKYAYGIETYFLSPARSKRAKRVASIENKGDMKNMGWSSKNSLLTVLNQAKITASNKMAIDIQRNMLFTLRGKYGKKSIKDGGVREGPFWVLVGAQMPSVLIEVGYISHPVEGKRISTKTYQKRIANGIANGIESYFIKN